MSVRCLLYIYDFSRLVSWWATALCLLILRPLKKILLHRGRVIAEKYLYPSFGIMCNWGWFVCIVRRSFWSGCQCIRGM